MNHWSFDSLLDITGNIYMIGVNAVFTFDRFCNYNSAFYVQNGYFQISPGIFIANLVYYKLSIYLYSII
jgi:hypothetical protein